MSNVIFMEEIMSGLHPETISRLNSISDELGMSATALLSHYLHNEYQHRPISLNQNLYAQMPENSNNHSPERIHYDNWAFGFKNDKYFSFSKLSSIIDVRYCQMAKHKAIRQPFNFENYRNLDEDLADLI